MARITAVWRDSALSLSVDAGYLAAAAETQAQMIAELRAQLAQAAAAVGVRETTELSPSERRVVEGILRGKTSRQIAGEMGRAVSTVETWRARAIRKMGGAAL